MRPAYRILPVLVLLAALAPLLRARRAETLPLYAARTGLMCQTCHFDPNGGGPRNEFGFAFAKNRHTIEPDTTAAWKDLDLTNRVSDRLPLYVGLNQRFMLLGNKMVTKSLDRLAFFNMENAIYMTFQPHPRLTLSYSRDGFDGGSITQDAFALITGFPMDAYVKAGRFRTPFGLRMDDHTVATRNSFLDFETAQSFLPYDPRFPDMGVEVGADHGPLFGRVALTNGASDVFGSEPNADAVTGKLGLNGRFGQMAASFYDDYLKNGQGPFRRATRWGVYGLTHVRRLVLLGEAAAGTDKEVAGGSKNLLAAYAEADYAFNRVVNLRVRYDVFQGDRSDALVVRPDSSEVSLRDLNTYQRVALEGEFMLVPFAELRWAVRQIVPTASADAQGNALNNETQGFLQLHLSY